MVAGGNACQNGVKISTPILVRFPLKILQIISGRNINGALTYCRFLSEHLVARGHEVTILCRANSWMEEQPIPGVRYFHSEMNRPESPSSQPLTIGLCNCTGSLTISWSPTPTQPASISAASIVFRQKSCKRFIVSRTLSVSTQSRPKVNESRLGSHGGRPTIF